MDYDTMRVRFPEYLVEEPRAPREIGGLFLYVLNRILFTSILACQQLNSN